MLFLIIVDGKAVEAVESHKDVAGRVEESRWDWKSLETVEQRAAELNAANPGKFYMGIDAGPNVSPRFDVIRGPKVGDAVSYGFNGDSYPCGTITKISDSMRVVYTSEGEVFWRRRKSGAWVMNNYWSLMFGTHNERNPSF